MTDATFRARVLADVEDEGVRAYLWDRFEPLSVTKKLQHAGEVLNKITSLLITPAMRRVLGQRSVPPLRSLLSEPGLVSLAVDRLHGAAHLIGALFVSALQTAVMGRSHRPGAPHSPLSLYVDEFQTKATKRFETIISEGRRFGLELVMGHQNAHQLETGLLHALHALRGNANTQSRATTMRPTKGTEHL